MTSENFVPVGDLNNLDDIYVKNLHDGSLTWVSNNSQGKGANYSSDAPTLLADTTKVVFRSYANNLVPESTYGGHWGIYLKDLSTGSVTRLDTLPSGQTAGAFLYSITPDGSKIVFDSNDLFFNLRFSGAQTAPYQDNVFIKDLNTGVVTPVSTDPSGNILHSYSHGGVISPDGSAVAFTSDAANILDGRPNTEQNLFLKNLTSGLTTVISADAAGNLGNSYSGNPVFSADGTKVAFWSYASNLVPNDTNGATDIFVKDLASGVITRVSTGVHGEQAHGDSYLASSGMVFSPDGSSVLFSSQADNLTAESAGRMDVYLKNLVTGGIQLLARDAHGNPGDSASAGGVFSNDGRAFFFSLARNFVPGANPGIFNIYTVSFTSEDTAPIPSNGAVTTYGAVQNAVWGYDPDGDVLTYALASGPTHGKVTLFHSDGAFSYNPDPGYVGDDVFTYTVSDGTHFATGHFDVHVLARTIGTPDADVLTGGGGPDSLPAFAGDDSLIGAGGSDSLDGGSGADTMAGGPGDDLYTVNSRGDMVVEAAGEGRDTVQAGFNYTLPTNVEDLILLDTSDIAGIGNASDNVLTGNAGANLLLGKSGSDTLMGGEGADTLDGGSSGDLLTGGGGADIFSFASPANIGSFVERITDFSHAEGDKIDLSLIDGDTTAPNDQAFVFIGSTLFGHTAGELRAFAQNGAWMLQGDVNGDGKADFTLLVNAPIATGDFIL